MTQVFSPFRALGALATLLSLSGCATAWGPAVGPGKLLHPLENEMRSLVASCGLENRRSAADGGDTTLPPLLYGARVGQTFVRDLAGSTVGVTTPEGVFDSVYSGALTAQAPLPEMRTDIRLVDGGHVSVNREETARGSYRYHCKSYAFAAIEGGASLAGADAKSALEGKHENTSAVTIHVGRFVSDLAERLALGEPLAKQEILALYLRNPDLAKKEASILRAVTAAVVLVTEAGEADTKASGSIGWTGSFAVLTGSTKVGGGHDAESSGDAKNTIVTVGNDATWVRLPSAESLAHGLSIDAAVAPESFSFIMENVPAEIVLTAKVAKPLCEKRWWTALGAGRELVRVTVEGSTCRFVVRADWKGLDREQRAAADKGEVALPIALKAKIGSEATVDVAETVLLKSGPEPLVVLKTGESAASDREVAFSFDIWTSIVTDEFAKRFKVGQTWGAPTEARIACGPQSVPLNVNVRVHQPAQVGAPPTLWLGVPRADVEKYAGRGCTFSVTLAVPVVEREGGGSRQVKWAFQDRRLDVPAWLAPQPSPGAGTVSNSSSNMTEPPPMSSPVP